MAARPGLLESPYSGLAVCVLGIANWVWMSKQDRWREHKNRPTGPGQRLRGRSGRKRLWALGKEPVRRLDRPRPMTSAASCPMCHQEKAVSLQDPIEGCLADHKRLSCLFHPA